MKRVMVRYRVKADQVETNEALVRDVYEELARVCPDGLRYMTLKLDDGVTFIHLAEHADTNPLLAVEAFQRFVAGIRERCDEPPATVEIEQIGSYGFPGEDVR